jgi:hypothetical protein
MSEATEPVKAGDPIHLVSAWKHHCPGVVDKVHNEGLIDLTAMLPSGEPIKITSSPRDDRGTLPDSWHPAGVAQN